jgi:hypothetical protein
MFGSCPFNITPQKILKLSRYDNIKTDRKESGVQQCGWDLACLG